MQSTHGESYFWNDDALEQALESKVQEDMESSSWVGEYHSASELRQLVLLVGPQGTSFINEVAPLFLHYASEHRPRQHAPALQQWVWPSLETSTTQDSDNEHHWDAWALTRDENIQGAAMLEQFQQSWKDQAYRNFILGSSSLDQSVGRITDLVAATHPQEEPVQVTVVMQYSKSRLQQWLQLMPSEEEFEGTFRDWVCQEDQAVAQQQILSSSLDPLAIANALRIKGGGWNVVVLDEEGMRQAQQHPAHVVACRVLVHTQCDSEGWLKDVPRRQVSSETSTSTSASSPRLQDLSAIQIAELESMLTDRDCFYRDALLHDDVVGFRYLFPKVLWQHCDGVSESEYYERLSQIRHVWQQVQHILHCGRTETLEPSDIDTQDPEEPLWPDTVWSSKNNANAKNTSHSFRLVQDSLQRETKIGMGVFSTFIALLAVWVMAVQYRRYRQRRQAQDRLLRQWNHDTSRPGGFFSPETVESSVVLNLPPLERNLQAYHDNDGQQQNQRDNDPDENVLSPPRVSYRDRLYQEDVVFMEEIDLHHLSTTPRGGDMA